MVFKNTEWLHVLATYRWFYSTQYIWLHRIALHCFALALYAYTVARDTSGFLHKQTADPMSTREWCCRLILSWAWGNVSIHKWTDRRKFRSQTSDNMDRWKAEQGGGREKRKIRREKSRRERVRRKKMQIRKKVGKSRNALFFQWFVAPEGRKVGSLKRRVQSQLARWEMKNCTPLWHEAHFEVKMYKTPQCRTTFGSWDVEKVSKCTKHTIVGPLLEVEMSKKCTPLWHEANFEVKMYKTHHTSCSRHFWRFRCRKSARRCGANHISKSKCKKNHPGFGQLLEVQMSLRFTTLHYTTLHYTALHYATQHYTTLQLQLHNYTPLHSTTLHYTKSHYTTLHYTTLHYITLHYMTLFFYTSLHYTTLHHLPLHFTTLHYTTLHYNYNYEYTTTLHYTKLHYTTLHYTTLHYIPLHYITLHYIPLHYTTLHYTEWHCTTDRQVNR